MCWAHDVDLIGFAFVKMEESDSVEKALKGLVGAKLYDREIRVEVKISVYSRLDKPYIRCVLDGHWRRRTSSR